MSKKKILKVAIVGAWGHCGFVIKDFVNNKPKNAELVAMGQTSIDEPLWKTSDLDKIARFNDYRDMLIKIKPDVAVVSTRLDLLNKAAITAAESCY